MKEILENTWFFRARIWPATHGYTRVGWTDKEKKPCFCPAQKFRIPHARAHTFREEKEEKSGDKEEGEGAFV